jgi:hypothetical protein
VRVLGTILCLAGTLMTITGVRLGFTLYDLTSTHDLSKWAGGERDCPLLARELADALEASG